MSNPQLVVAVGMALLGGLVPIVFMMYLVWIDRKRQNNVGIDE